MDPAIPHTDIGPPMRRVCQASLKQGLQPAQILGQSPLFCPLLKARGNRAEAVVEFEPRSLQGWAAIVCKRTATGRTVAPHDLGFRVAPSCETPFDWACPAHTLFQFFLGMAVGCINGLGGLVEI